MVSVPRSRAMTLSSCRGDKPLRLYTLYAPPEHRDGTVHPTKTDAERAEEHFEGKVTEGSE